MEGVQERKGEGAKERKGKGGRDGRRGMEGGKGSADSRREWTLTASLPLLSPLTEPTTLIINLVTK